MAQLLLLLCICIGNMTIVEWEELPSFCNFSFTSVSKYRNGLFSTSVLSLVTQAFSPVILLIHLRRILYAEYDKKTKPNFWQWDTDLLSAWQWDCLRSPCWVCPSVYYTCPVACLASSQNKTVSRWRCCCSYCDITFIYSNQAGEMVLSSADVCCKFSRIPYTVRFSPSRHLLQLRCVLLS